MLRFDCARDKTIQVWEKMAKERGISIRAWREHLHQLEDAGWLRRRMHDIEGVGVRASVRVFVVRGGRKSTPVTDQIAGRT
jgi:predicted ArsR family transcriptional regulator